MAENWLTVRGNHDRELAEKAIPDLEDCDQFVREHLTQEALEWLAQLPAARTLGGDLLLCHGSPASDEVYLLEEDGGNHFHPSSEEQVRAKLGPHGTALVLCGHTHTPRVVRLPNGPTILNPGSVGVQAFPGLTLTASPHARYAIAERRADKWSFRQNAITYDWDTAARQAEALGFPTWSAGLATGFAPIR
jgi:diadenosine tetraphosphatase ApaH/serine/threonine PP2A family protein phosphatase